MSSWSLFFPNQSQIKRCVVMYRIKCLTFNFDHLDSLLHRLCPQFPFSRMFGRMLDLFFVDLNLCMKSAVQASFCGHTAFVNETPGHCMAWALFPKNTQETNVLFVSYIYVFDTVVCRFHGWHWLQWFLRGLLVHHSQLSWIWSSLIPDFTHATITNITYSIPK